MFEIDINCIKNNIQCDTTSKSIRDCENNENYTRCCLIKLPENLKKYKNNIKVFKQITERDSWYCNCTYLEFVDYDLTNNRSMSYDYLVFEFETEEEAFYFKLKYGG